MGCQRTKKLILLHHERIKYVVYKTNYTEWAEQNCVQEHC